MTRDVAAVAIVLGYVLAAACLVMGSMWLVWRLIARLIGGG